MMKVCFEEDGVRVMEYEPGPVDQYETFQLEYPPLEPGKISKVTKVSFHRGSDFKVIMEELKKAALKLKEEKVTDNDMWLTEEGLETAVDLKLAELGMAAHDFTGEQCTVGGIIGPSPCPCFYCKNCDERIPVTQKDDPCLGKKETV